jgi:hypothetical protein
MNSLSVHGKAKALSDLNRQEEAIVSRTIELDDATSYALLRIGKCHEKLGNKVLALKFSARLFMKILFGQRMDCDYRFYVRQKLSESLILCSIKR